MLTVIRLTKIITRLCLVGTATFEGAAIDAVIFAGNFELNSNGALVPTAVAVPEPSSLALLGWGVVGMVSRRRR